VLPRNTAFTLYDDRSTLLSDGVPHDAQRTHISVAGRSWVLAIGEPAADLSLTETVLIVGGLLTLLLVALSVQASRRERYALKMVDRRLAEREQAELALRQLTANDPLGPERIETRLEWVARIRAALDDGRLTLHAQPVVETTSRHTTQHELLVRMIDTDGSLVPPAQFLPIAERFGLIREIDRWVVTETIAILRRQRELGRKPTVEINLSGQSLGDTGLAAHIGSKLRAAQVDPGQLVFEVTETTAIGNIAAARDFARQLARLGCRFALDDFGAGFGSFYYLKHLPFDYIKIDGEFVRNCTVDVTDRLVIRAVIKLAQGMGTRTIAEFVGDEKTFATVAALGVDYAQGFHLGKPAPVESAFGTESVTP
jgi:EAL domain-containing protein (putative c-di-GMP-specific phosphodiesterase class I)